MGGNTHEGGLKAYETNLKRHGADFYVRLGRKGGSTPNKTPKGFAAMSPEGRTAAGRKGGTRKNVGDLCNNGHKLTGNNVLFMRNGHLGCVQCIKER